MVYAVVGAVESTLIYSICYIWDCWYDKHSWNHVMTSNWGAVHAAAQTYFVIGPIIR